VDKREWFTPILKPKLSFLEGVDVVELSCENVIENKLLKAKEMRIGFFIVLWFLVK
jgi:hypothetical protein